MHAQEPQTYIHTYKLHARRINIGSANARSTVRNSPSAHIKIYQTADGEECKGGPAHFDQDNKSPGCCDQTMTSATSSSHSPTLSTASYPCCRYQRNASQVKVNSKAHVVWWPSVD